MDHVPHSAAVHIPVSLAILMPWMFIATAVAVKLTWLPERVWSGLALLAVVQCVALGLSLVTGERAEFLSAGDAVIMERHEHAAKLLAALWIPAAAGLIWLAVRGGGKLILAALVVVLMAQMMIAVHAGHLGGQLLP